MRAGIGFGSNLGDRLNHLRQARGILQGLPHVAGPFLASRVWETEPVDSELSAGAFLNAVLEIEVAGVPATLLGALQTIEAALGRPSRRPRNAPRIIDLDVLYFGNSVLSNAEIVIPHPRLHLRRFVLEPLAEIRPELVLPGRELTVAALLAGLQDGARVELFAKQWEP